MHQVDFPHFADEIISKMATLGKGERALSKHAVRNSQKQSRKQNNRLQRDELLCRGEWCKGHQQTMAPTQHFIKLNIVNKIESVH